MCATDPGDASVPVFLSVPGTVDHGTAATIATCAPPLTTGIDCQHRGLRCPVSGDGGGSRGRGHPGKAQTLSYQNVTRKLAREVSPADLLVINCRIPLNVE